MNKKILIVEDENEIREAMNEAVTTAGYETVSATNGKEGLQMAMAEKPDLILLDLRMPVMSGFEMLSDLRRDDWGKGVKVIVMTQAEDMDSIAEARQADLADYMVKAHTSLEELVERVNEEMVGE